MTMFRWELKKIWRPGILAALLLLGSLYYYMWPSFYIRYFANGPYSAAQQDLAREWVVVYGPTLEPEEREEVGMQLQRELDDFAEAVASIPQAVEAGICSYDTFCAFKDAHLPDTEQLQNRVQRDTNYYRISTLENFLELYDDQEAHPTRMTETALINAASDGSYSSAMVERTRELEEGGGFYGYLPFGVEESTARYTSYLAVWVVLSVILLLSPTLVRDRLNRMRPAQWTSRRGRGILRMQMAAGLCSATFLTVVNLTIYAVPFLRQGALDFRMFPLTGLHGWGIPWFDGTYGQFLLLAAVVLLALGMGTGLVTVFLSRFSGNYVAMLLKAIPLFVALGPLMGFWMMDRLGKFRWLGPGSAVPLPPWTELYVLLALVLTGAVLCALAYRKDLKKEL